MKRKIIILKNILKVVSALVCIVICSIALTGCFKRMDRYLAVVPTDQEYKATLTHHLETSNGNYDHSWTVIRKNVNFCGENRMVIYVEYSSVDNRNHYHDYEKVLLYTYNYNTSEGYSLTLNGNQWENDTSLFSGWSDIYGSYSKSGSFVYEITRDINGRDFPSNKKVETSEYLEYDFGRDNEVFRISNNPYHLLLHYSFDYQDTHVLKEGTLTLGTPSETIPYLSTITYAMIGE